MYDYIPPRKNAIAKLLVLSLAALAAAAFVGSAFLPKYPALLQIVAVALCVPIIQIVARYLVMRYLYRLRDETAEFEVYAYRGGAKMQLVCRVGLEEITAVAPLGESNRKPPRGQRRYNYCPDIRPEGAVVVSITNGDGDCELLLVPDEAILRALTGAAVASKMQRDSDGGDDRNENDETGGDGSETTA